MLGGDYGIAGSVTGVVAGGAAVLVFAGWVWARFPRAEAVTAIAVLLLYRTRSSCVAPPTPMGFSF